MATHGKGGDKEIDGGGSDSRVDEKSCEAAEDNVEEGNQDQGGSQHPGTGEVEAPGEDANDEAGAHIYRGKGEEGDRTVVKELCQQIGEKAGEYAGYYAEEGGYHSCPDGVEKEGNIGDHRENAQGGSDRRGKENCGYNNHRFSGKDAKAKTLLLLHAPLPAYCDRIPTLHDMESPRYRAFTPLLIFTLLTLGGLISATVLLNSVGRSQEEMVRLRVALAYLEPGSYDTELTGLDKEDWFDTAASLVPASHGARLLLSGRIGPEEATPAQIREAALWVDQYRSRNGRAMTLLMSLLMVTSLLLAFLLYRTGRLVTQVLGERGRALELASRLNQAQEQERTRTARELESGVARALSSASLQLRDGESGELAEQIDDALDRVRFLVYRMKEPERLGDDLLGLVSGLCEAFSRETGISTKCDGNELQRRWFGRELALHVYRIAQELLTNAARHSMARSVSISLREVQGKLHLLYRDDGVGIPETALRGTMGMGLTNMADRAALLGGSFRVREENSTTVEVVIPLRRV